jgi:GT2 family glycosyltransferase
MLISFIISTYNRRDELLRTLDRLTSLGLDDRTYEIHVIDNASTDGTADAVSQMPYVRLYPQFTNRGSCAKNLALPHAQGEFIVFLDDDSYPQPLSIERMVQHFRRRPSLGAATFTVTLPDGSRECSAYPNVFIGCGVGLRKTALDQVGALPEDFFMQAEEYDLSLRLLDAGWDVETFDDLHITHLKTPRSRVPDRVMRLDVRNNLIVAARYFPDEWASAFCIDWMLRYGLIASAKRQRRPYLMGLAQGLVEALRHPRRPISDEAFEQFAKIKLIQQRMTQAKHDYGISRLLLIDLGKNILPYHLAANASGIEIVAIADGRLAGRKYRGIPILTDAQAQRQFFDAAIIANSSPVHAQQRTAAWLAICHRPIIDLLAEEPAPALLAA